MKRSVPATPFRVIGGGDQGDLTTSSECPETPANESPRRLPRLLRLLARLAAGTCFFVSGDPIGTYDLWAILASSYFVFWTGIRSC